MGVEYIIVQAGGRGSRLESLTRNKPKALVPINNKPMIFHLFDKFPDKKYIIIGDYKYDVLKRYLETFAEVDFKLVQATGAHGTCAGISKALDLVPSEAPFMLIWCDIVLSNEYEIPNPDRNYIGISQDFECRWSFYNRSFYEVSSIEHGVAGLFIFSQKEQISDVPLDGEFVAWLSDKELEFTENPLHKAHEYGVFKEWERIPAAKCRPFNKIEIEGDVIIKEPIDEIGRSLSVREKNWYKKVEEVDVEDKIKIPKILSYEPFKMIKIDGANIYEYTNITEEQKQSILKKIITSLKGLHDIESVPFDKDSYLEAYIGKTKARLEKIKNLVPFAGEERIRINGIECRNIFNNWDIVENLIMEYAPEKFVLLHGDCTFSNIMLDQYENPILIDPRGYFGNTELFGDAAYDWVKLYYSIYSNYDQFNLKRFSLSINEADIELQIESNHWENTENVFFEFLSGKVTRKQMKLLLAIVWLSLTTYAWEDYDSVCGAFYQGLMYLEEALLMSNTGTPDEYFGRTMKILNHSLASLDMNSLDDLLSDCSSVLKNGHKIIASGLGKNVPVCEKFVGTLLSLGLDANFLHTNSAVHGDMGMVHPGDLVIILSKSGNTEESVYLANLLKERHNVIVWSLCFNDAGKIIGIVGKKKSLVVHLEHEGDPWDIMPNNSTTLNLIILQGIAMSLIKRLDLSLEKDFKPNHPGGAIGAKLNA